MHRDGASASFGLDGGNKMTMKFSSSTAIPSLHGSSRVADLTIPLPYSSIFSDHSTSTGASSDLSLLILRHKDLLVRHQTCLSQLQKTFKAAETLRQENTNLRIANGDLNNRLNEVVDAYLQKQYASMMIPSPDSTSPFSPEYVTAPLPSITERIGGLCVNEKIRETRECGASRWESCESPTSVMENDRSQRNAVRSAFLSRSTNPSRPAVPVNASQKMCKYNQEMTKIQLRKKSQETGSYPYGNKTEVCRMVLAGDRCPFRKHCRFRHALTEEEKLVVPLKLD